MASACACLLPNFLIQASTLGWGSYHQHRLRMGKRLSLSPAQFSFSSVYAWARNFYQRPPLHNGERLRSPPIQFPHSSVHVGRGITIIAPQGQALALASHPILSLKRPRLGGELLPPPSPKRPRLGREFHLSQASTPGQGEETHPSRRHHHRPQQPPPACTRKLGIYLALWVLLGYTSSVAAPTASGGPFTTNLAPTLVEARPDCYRTELMTQSMFLLFEKTYSSLPLMVNAIVRGHFGLVILPTSMPDLSFNINPSSAGAIVDIEKKGDLKHLKGAQHQGETETSAQPPWLALSS
ncbi:hypothetical protein P692DRAFT_201811738 [Suillus brevipes Sb2]|nr:hypothetical protein P692DRAFT_201811738 [Suillus brevipes Sb2]